MRGRLHAVFTLKEKVIVTVVVLTLNVAVLAFMGWFVVLSGIPSFLLLAAVLTR